MGFETAKHAAQQIWLVQCSHEEQQMEGNSLPMVFSSMYFLAVSGVMTGMSTVTGT